MGIFDIGVKDALTSTTTLTRMSVSTSTIKESTIRYRHARSRCVSVGTRPDPAHGTNTRTVLEVAHKSAHASMMYYACISEHRHEPQTRVSQGSQGVLSRYSDTKEGLPPNFVYLNIDSCRWDATCRLVRRRLYAANSQQHSVENLPGQFEQMTRMR